ncbi:MAG: hypothetical protein H5U06_05990 [Candidatus Aminicenantes bacterium]|nr:hypothetical protein [Candidatus Aminicenantes bacterium]
MKPGKKTEAVKIFKSAEAFYRYLDRMLSAQGYVLIETCPVLKTKINNNPGVLEAAELDRRKG